MDFDGDGRVEPQFSSPGRRHRLGGQLFQGVQLAARHATHYAVRFDPERLDKDLALLAPDILPTFSVETFTAKGAVLDGVALSHKGPLALVELQNGDAPPSYVAGTENFYAITRYNWSSYYAMAVIELGREVAAAMPAASTAAR
jgi:membrane-bound lytic murein transglycosylase B